MEHLVRYFVFAAVCAGVAVLCATAFGACESERDASDDWIKSRSFPWLIALVLSLAHVLHFLVRAFGAMK